MFDDIVSNNYLEYIINSIPAQVYFKDVDLVYRWVNERFLQYKGITRGDVIGKRDIDIYPKEQANEIIQEDKHVIDSGFEIFYEHYSKSTDRYFAIRKTAIRDKNGDIQGILAVIMDITEEKKAVLQLEIAKKEIEESREKFKDILENANDFILSIETDGKIIYANRSFCEALRITETDIRDNNFFNYVSSQSKEQVYTVFDSIIRGIKISHSEFVLTTPEGREIVVEGSFTYRQYPSGSKYILAVFRDITQRKIDEERIRFLAYHDVLTELPNRLLFFDRVNMEISRSLRNGTFVSLIMMDLDKFKSVNDMFGHNVGDILLKDVSNRLRRIIRKIDTIARMGGDEFVIVLSDLKSFEDIEEVAKRIIEEISLPYLIGENKIEISASLGISIFPNDGNEPDTLLRKADIAMYKSKSRGGRSFSYYCR